MPNLSFLSIKHERFQRLPVPDAPNFEHMPQNLRHLILFDSWGFGYAFLRYVPSHPALLRNLETLSIRSNLEFEPVIAAIGVEGFPKLLSLTARFNWLDPSKLPPSLIHLDVNFTSFSQFASTKASRR